MMKLTKWIALTLVALMLLTTLVSCGSTFGTIKRNFEKADYTYVSEDEDGNSTARAISAELEKGEFNCKIHFFKTKTEAGAFGLSLSVPSYCMVLEFSSDKELKKALDEEGSATLKGMIKDAQESDMVRGNCVLIPLSLTKGEEMVEIFNK